MSVHIGSDLLIVHSIVASWSLEENPDSGSLGDPEKYFMTCNM